MKTPSIFGTLALAGIVILGQLPGHSVEAQEAAVEVEEPTTVSNGVALVEENVGVEDLTFLEDLTEQDLRRSAKVYREYYGGLLSLFKGASLNPEGYVKVTLVGSFIIVGGVAMGVPGYMITEIASSRGLAKFGSYLWRGANLSVVSGAILLVGTMTVATGDYLLSQEEAVELRMALEKIVEKLALLEGDHVAW